MSLFKREKPVQTTSAPQTNLAEVALNNIHDGVIMVNHNNAIEFVNPAAIIMLDCKSPENALGFDISLFIKLETKHGAPLPDNENLFLQSLRTNQPLDNFQAVLIAGPAEKRIPISLSLIPVSANSRIITFRNIAKELAEEGEQAEFISTASHEMRTPVATIDGYLSLCLNPQTATVDDRARGYLEAAEKASKHLGHLFQDLLDVTKLDDGRLRPNFVPLELIGVVRQIANDYRARAQEKKINFQFGTKEDANNPMLQNHLLEQVVYTAVDQNFLREILDNLLDNALKYTPAGGSIYVNVRGDGDRALINVTDTGAGISSDDLQHIFQKFYRADNSDTREIGGTGLGLYLVKQRVEAMNGRVWAESAFGQGSTFYVSLPRLTGEEYEKRMIAIRNAAMVQRPQPPQPSMPQPPQPAQPQVQQTIINQGETI